MTSIARNGMSSEPTAFREVLTRHSIAVPVEIVRVARVLLQDSLCFFMGRKVAQVLRHVGRSRKAAPRYYCEQIRVCVNPCPANKIPCCHYLISKKLKHSYGLSLVMGE